MVGNGECGAKDQEKCQYSGWRHLRGGEGVRWGLVLLRIKEVSRRSSILRLASFARWGGGEQW